MTAERRTEHFTPAQVAELRRTGTRIAPGIWADKDGALHFSVPELLRLFGWPDDKDHRAECEEVIRSVVAEQCPDATLVYGVEES